MTKKKAKKAVSRKKKAPAKKKARAKTTKHEIVVRVDSTPVIPTTTDLAEPMREGKKLAIQKTWLSDGQVIKIVQRTPKEHVYRRKGKGGKEFDYVTGAYVEKVLNFVFGWNWDMEVVAHGITGHFIWVQGKLTVRGTLPGQQIVKTQFGRAEIKYLRDKSKTPENMVDFGNDLKAATTDALKKCASLLGIASDIYGKGEYKEETGITPPEEPIIQLSPKETIAVLKEKYVAPALKSGQIIGPGGGVTWACSICGDPISDQVSEFSLKVYKKRLCREHQTKPTKR